MHDRPTDIAREAARQRTHRPPRRSVVLTIALSGFSALAFLYSIGPIHAAPPRTCQDRYADCTRRCIVSYDVGGEAGHAAAFRCVQRTCDKQFDNCVRDMGKAGGNGGKLALPPRDPLPPGGRGGPFSVPSGGILSTDTGLGGNGPSATGTPLAPRAPAVIIR